MKNFLFSLIVLVFLNCLSFVYSENSYYIVAIIRNKSDKYYVEESQEVQSKIDELVNDRMNDIYDVIEENVETYTLENGKLDQKLNELGSLSKEKRSQQRKKFLFINKNKPINKFYKRSLDLTKSDNSTTPEYIPFESNLVMHITDVLNYKLVSAYLSDETAKTVCSMENVLYCKKNFKLNIIGKEKLNNEKEFQINLKKRDVVYLNETTDDTEYYNIEAIKKETGWKEVMVKKFPFSKTANHLAFISQSPYYYEGKRIDDNYYYPSTAGQGIDIYAIDDGLIVDHIDFDTYEGTPYERTVSCDAQATETGIEKTTGDLKKKCTYKEGFYPGHGIMDLSVAGGTYSGVAKRANLHMITCDDSLISAYFALDFIYNNTIPNRTVLNLSLGWRQYLKDIDDILEKLNNKGVVIVDAACNENRNICESKESPKFSSFSGYNKSITVGAVTSITYKDGYIKAYNSNFGDCVDIFAPAEVTHASCENGNNKSFIEDGGTSCSAPIVSGVAALIMSEFPGNYNSYSMKEKLYDLSIKDAITNLKNGITSETPNYFVNIGKHSIYSPDDVNVKCGKGINASCSNGCCSKEGECIPFQNDPWEKCLIENGCQSEFGYCTTIENAIKECEKEVKENEECQFEIKEGMSRNEILSKGETFKTDKCQSFYRLQYTNQSVCAIAKKYKSFGFIDNYNREAYLNSEIRYNNERLVNTLSENRDCYQSNIDDNITEEELDKRCEVIYSDKCINFRKFLNEEYNKYSFFLDPIKQNQLKLRKKCSRDCWHPDGYPCCRNIKNVNKERWGKENGEDCYFPRKHELCPGFLLGFHCCESNQQVLYEDSTGKWGAVKDTWCSIPLVECPGYSLGYPCCFTTKTIVTEDENGKWGVEDDEWCSFPE